MKTEELNMDYVGLIQEYMLENKINDDNADEGSKPGGEGLKKVIKQMFVKSQILGFNELKEFFGNSEEAALLFDGIANKSTQAEARAVFEEAINELKGDIASKYGVGPRKKKSYEILAEKLDKKYGEGHMDNNVNSLLEKNIGNSGLGECQGGGCGC